jgi:hypothetical protein
MLRRRWSGKYDVLTPPAGRLYQIQGRMKKSEQKLRKNTTISLVSDAETTFTTAPRIAKVNEALNTQRAPATG